MADWNRDDEEHIGGEEDEGIISQEDCWSVIQSYFDENVLPKRSDSVLTLVSCANSNRIV